MVFAGRRRDRGRCRPARFEQALAAVQDAQHVERHDIAGAFPDRVDRSFAIVPGDRAFLDIAIAADALHRLIDQRGRDLAAPSIWQPAS
jgi:hypothetical protein